jgi:hypothetical protein
MAAGVKNSFFNAFEPLIIPSTRDRVLSGNKDSYFLTTMDSKVDSKVLKGINHR